MSRRQIIEEKKSLKKTYNYIFGGLIFLFIFLVFGIPLLVNFSAFLSGILSPQKIVKKKIERFVQKPSLEIPYEATKSAEIKVNGYGPANLPVSLFINGEKTYSLTVNKTGQFSFDKVELNEGDNELYAIVRDPDSEKDATSDVVSVIYDKTPPKLELDGLTDGQEFVLNNQITIKGKVSENSQLYLNDTFVMINSDNSFSQDILLNEGDNKLTFVVTDTAGNETKQELTVRFRK